MQLKNQDLTGKVALVTGSAGRIGAKFINAMHEHGASVVIHYGRSAEPAKKLCKELNAIRENSAHVLQADLCTVQTCEQLIDNAAKLHNQLDILVNNASSFYPTPIGGATESQWNDLHCSNLKAPFFLSQTATPWLKKSKGKIVNMVDIHGQTPLSEHTIYCAAKAGLIMLTQSLAKELAPEICVNAIAPGAILWPETDSVLSDANKQSIIDEIPMEKLGHPWDLANMLLFLVGKESNYITGQIFTVDGGKSL